MDIELCHIHKHFGAVKANDGIDLRVSSGSIHGILGENGAGKSTLMKILGGLIHADSGTIRLDGSVATLHTPQAAMRHGIGMLFQEPLDFPALSVLDNFILGQSAVHPRLEQRRRFIELVSEVGFQLNPDAAMDTLSVGERQQVEILRLMGMGIRLLILDEPTTGISALQKNDLFEALRRFAAGNKTVLLVSHKLEDVETLCHGVTVLRQGRVAGSMPRPFSPRALLGMMFPNPPSGTGAAPPSRQRGSAVLRLTDITVPGGRTGLKQCTVTACEGEILGLAGLEGSGQGEFLRAAAGLSRTAQGRVLIGDDDLTGAPHNRFQDNGVVYLPGNRVQEGLIEGLSVAEHAALIHRDSGFFRPGRRATARAAESIQAFQIAGTPGTPVEALSGGNQQRLMLSFLPASPRLLLLENPTRGLDVESGLWIWQHLQRLCSQGACIIFASAELDEIMMAASRILVFFDGRIIHDTPAGATSVQALGNAIAGNVSP